MLLIVLILQPLAVVRICTENVCREHSNKNNFFRALLWPELPLLGD